MVASPCLSPLVVYNKALQRYIHVPCGHCDACLASKGKSRVDRINNDFLKYHYRYFVTLTYEDLFLPLATPDYVLGAFVHANDSDYNGEVYNVRFNNPMAINCANFINSRLRQFGGIPVLSHSDVINFKKRFRKHVYSIIKEYPQIYVYACGEYGPTTFRPHYHLLFGFDDERINPIFESCICKAWSLCSKGRTPRVLRQFGAIDVQRCYDRNGANYCANYLSCTTNLPFVLSRTVFRPFCSSSCGEYRRMDRESFDVRKFYIDCPVEVSQRCSSSTELTTKPTPDSYKNRVFPKFAFFSRLSSDARESLFRFTIPLVTRCGFSCSTIAKLVILRYRFYNTFHAYKFPDAFQKYFEWCEAENDVFYLENHLTLLFQVSRRISHVLSVVGCTITDYFRRHDYFYSRVELFKLKNFYEYIIDKYNDPYAGFDKKKELSLYYNTEHLQFTDVSDTFGVSIDNLNHDTLLSCDSYPSITHKIVLDTTKTKKRNDYFTSTGRKRKPWVPRVSRNITKFFSY